MFDYLEGKVAVRKPTHVVLDVNGVGYRVETPLSTYESLKANGSAKLYTVLKTSNEEMKLYGFASLQEREVFLQLISHVNRLGPAKALAILSSAGVERLAQAIEQGDVAFLRRIKGIGDKIAQRLVLELKGKLEFIGKAGAAETSVTRDAVQALVSLGYERRDADDAVTQAQKSAGKEAPLETLIKKSLEYTR